MGSRRDFIKKILALSAWPALVKDRPSDRSSPALAAVGKKKLPKGIGRDALKDMNPGTIDASDAAITPLEDFGTMGLDDHETDIDSWRLIMDGNVREPLKLTYPEVQAAPSVERTVLLICPGVFANQGVWQGVSVRSLLTRAGMNEKVNFVTFRGPEGRYEKVMRVPIEDAMSDRVFLAHHVNGSPLPGKHGFPLRLVAEGYYGYDWVKYVYRVTADVIET